MARKNFPVKIFNRQYLPAVINVGLLALWLWLYRAVFPYLAVIFSREEFRTNQIVLMAIIVLVVLQTKRERTKLGWQLTLNLLPQFSVVPLAVVVGGSILYLLVERFLDINTLSATLFGLTSYGLLGLWMPPERWRKGLPAALLFIGALPFGEHIQTFIGYPVRVLTAAAVKDGLAAAGIRSVTIDTILVFENGISKVDLPCSGVKSLWSGGLFFLAVTWIDRRSVNLRWLLGALGFVVLLLAANLVRVAILVSVGQVAGWRLLAEMLHVPLGVVGFSASCLLGLALLRWVGRREDIPKSQTDVISPVMRPRWLGPALCTSLMVMAVLYSPRPEIVFAQTELDWRNPSALETQPWPLNAGEREWIQQTGAQQVERRRFHWRGIDGSILLVSSTSWRAHHRPERCFEVYGLTPEESRTVLVAPDFPVRLLALVSSGAGGSAGSQEILLSATYWLQSVSQITDDYATRIWDDLSPQRQEWILVTILFDDPSAADSADARELYQVLREVVQQNLLREVQQ